MHCWGSSKQALIQDAVTGRIDVRTGRPYPAYKDSGVGWLGKIPAHWDLGRNGRLFAERNETGFGQLPILEVSLRTGVRVRDMENGTRKQQIEDRAKYKRAVRGDIAYNMMRMWQGAVGVAPVDGLISPAYVVARPLPGVETRYYEYLFRTDAYMGQVNTISRGIVPDRNRLYWEDFKGIPSLVPPRQEQRSVATFLERQERLVGRLIEIQRGLVRGLEEHKSALISQVVTGKLDVREAAARLPKMEVPAGGEDEPVAPQEHSRASLDEAAAVP